MDERNSLSRDIMMLLGGMAAGIAGSRLLPPLYAAVTGSSRVRTGGDPFRMLMDDHREILSLLDEMLQARPDQLRIAPSCFSCSSASSRNTHSPRRM